MKKYQALLKGIVDIFVLIKKLYINKYYVKIEMIVPKEETK